MSDLKLNQKHFRLAGNAVRLEMKSIECHSMTQRNEGFVAGLTDGDSDYCARTQEGTVLPTSSFSVTKSEMSIHQPSAQTPVHHHPQSSPAAVGREREAGAWVSASILRTTIT